MLLASASNAIIIGFNVRPERKTAELAEQEGVEIRLHSIIYELQDEIRKAMLGLLDPVFKESYLGRAEVLNVFRIPKVGTIAGCRVTDGVLRRDAEVRLIARWRAGLQGQARLAQALQGRCSRSHQRHGVRCRSVELQRRPSWRQHRSLCHRASRGRAYGKLGLAGPIIYQERAIDSHAFLLHDIPHLCPPEESLTMSHKGKTSWLKR